MSEYKVVVQLPTGYSVYVKVPDDVPIREILPKLTGIINESRALDSKKARYQIDSDQLQEPEYSKTLKDIGVNKDFQLRIDLGPERRSLLKLPSSTSKTKQKKDKKPKNHKVTILPNKEKNAQPTAKEISIQPQKKSQIKILPKRKNKFLKVKSPPFDDGFLWPCHILRENLPLKIYYTTKANIEMSLHACANPTQEVGGVLIGEVYESTEEEESTFVVITDSIIGQFTVESATRLNFTHETWVQIQEEKETLFPEKEIVGWYHTHPNLGIFLSQFDLFIHESFFKEPWQVALVLDPKALRGGFFQWEKGKKLHNKPFSEFTIFQSKLSYQKYH